MNPLDTKLRRNRFAGFSARAGNNALANSRWGKSNPNGIPVQKLGIVWNSIINGLRLIESIRNECSEVSSSRSDSRKDHIENGKESIQQH